MNNKIVLTKRTSAVFLAIVLVTGIIALSFPSFIIKGMEAQAQPYYDYGIDNRYNNYVPQEYQSYKPDYKPQYPSYGKDDNRDKSKDSSDIINKIKCTTNNIVVNGNNTGDINIGNKGGVATEEGDWSASSSGNGGYGYDNNKKDKGFECIINNNNIINNIVAGAGGNVSDGNVTDTCEECFLDALGPANLILLENFLAGQPPTASNNLEEFCLNLETQIASGTSFEVITGFINNILLPAGITLDPAELARLTACIFEVVVGWTSNNTRDLVPFDINTDISVFGPMMTLPTSFYF